jgi:hypothetical protein
VSGVTIADLCAVVLAVPLITSVTANAWSLVWHPMNDGPLGPRAHRALLLAEGAVALSLLVPVGTMVQFTAASVLYAALGGGVLVLLRRRGPVPCGCWGRTGHKLGGRLVVGNLALALLALTQLGGQRTIGPGAGAVLAIALFVLALVLIVALPEMRHALRGATTRADSERRWFNGFPDLERV